MPAPLLKTKFYFPHLPPSQVLRSRLVARLEDGLQSGHRLTLVSAPAGFGKTTLLATWLHNRDGKASHVAWLTVDEEDDEDPVRFWVYFLSALQSILPDFGEIALAMLNASPPVDMGTVLTSLINELVTLPVSILLVLDDYHFIQARVIHEALSFLIEHAPPQLHLALATRVDPPLNIARLRVRGQMTELRANDLRFTLQEAADFLNDGMQLGLSPSDVGALESRTEGWIAALQVAAMAMRDREDVADFVAAFTGSHRHVLNYLVEEVFAQQPEPVRTFLLKTSVLERLCGPLCDALTGRDDGQAMLEQLENDNVFVIALDDERHWYRYHHLFRDALRARHQRISATEAIANLHQRASVWYEHNGRVHQAVQHALRIADFERVAALLSDPAIEMIGVYGLTTLHRWLDALPDAIVRKTVNLSMAYAWVFLARSQPAEVAAHLRDVEHVLSVSADGSAASFAVAPRVRCLLAEVLSIRANVAFHHSDLARVLALSQRAKRYLDDEVKAVLPHKYAALQGIITFNMGLAYEFSGELHEAAEQFELSQHLNHQVGNWHLLPVATGHLAQVLKTQGRLKQAAETYRRAIRYTEEATAPPSPLSGMAHTGLGHILYEFNALDDAEACLQRGIALAQPWTHWETLVSGTIDLSRIKAAREAWTEAHAHLQELDVPLTESEAPWGRALLRAQRAWLWLRQGDLDAVRAWMQQIDLDADSDIIYLRETEFIILARVYIAVGEIQSAIHLLERLCAANAEHAYAGRHIVCLALLALAQAAQPRPEVAVATLQRALALAAPEGYIRLFVDMGVPMQALLSKVATHSPDLSAYVNTLLRAFPTPQAEVDISHPGPRTPQPLVEPLSERELELLALIATGMTNRAIADQLVVSINTVKTHARNIYGKLGVRNRTEAVARARALGMIEA